MVFDWFRRKAAPEGPAQTPQEPAAGEEPQAAEPPVPLESAAVDQDALAWARQAYARLKAQQEADRATQEPVAVPPPAAVAPEPPTPARQVPAAEPFTPELPAPELPAPEPPAAPDLAAQETAAAAAAVSPPSGAAEPAVTTVAEPATILAEPAPVAPLPAESAATPPPPSPPSGLSLLEQAAAQREQRLRELTATSLAVATPAPASAAPLAVPAAEGAEPQLGAFDDTFTWSVEVLAAQGRRADEVSLEEVDWLGRLRRGLEKTRRGFVTQLLDNLGDDPLTPEVLDGLETTLLRADVGVQATDQVLDALRKRLNEEVVDPAEGIRFLKEQLRGLLDAPITASGHDLLAPRHDRLNVWLLVGVNGVGKTTTLGKLANLAVRSGYSCLIAAADTFRAAAVEQVSIWGERSGVPVIANPSANADPAAVVYDAIGAARSKGIELVLVDTAGRLQTKHNLMEELSKVRRIVDKLAPEAAVESLLVLDASQGQNGLRQAMAFASAAGLTGVVLTKLDGSARGGVAIAVAHEAALPIRFVGAGEGIRDLRPFNSFEFVEALLTA